MLKTHRNMIRFNTEKHDVKTLNPEFHFMKAVNYIGKYSRQCS